MILIKKKQSIGMLNLNIQIQLHLIQQKFYDHKISNSIGAFVYYCLLQPQ